MPFRPGLGRTCSRACSSAALVVILYLFSSNLKRVRWEESGMILEWYGTKTSRYRWEEISSITLADGDARVVTERGDEITIPLSGRRGEEMTAAIRMYLKREGKAQTE